MATVETRYCYRHPDRPTGLSCSECGRPICTECMTPAAVGLRCPDHAGSTNRRRLSPPRVARSPRRVLATHATNTLIALNVVVYLVTAVQGRGINAPGGALFDKFILYGPYLHQGEWWRLVTAMFLHGFLMHIALNMLALWIIGRAVEGYLGPTRFVLLYFVSGLAGSAGALIQSPTTPVVGASGAIFGVLGGMLILEWQATGRLAGNALTWIVINLAFNFAYNGVGGDISIGGHVGGVIGGILVTLGFAHWGRGQAAYGRIGYAGVLGLVLVGAASVALAYWKVRGLA
jgi:membrane associated rhomboid family serine protease